MDNYQETIQAWSHLYDEISDDELKSLDNPTVEEQEKEWAKILDNLTTEKIALLVESIGFSLESWRSFSESKGVINKIYMLSVKSKTPESDAVELVLRVSNPHPFWKRNRTVCMIAIMERARDRVPVPKILCYSSDPDTSLLGCDYILMEKVDGILLSDVIENCTDSDTIPDSLIDELIAIVQNLKQINSYEKPLIGMFAKDMEISRFAFDGPMVGPCETYYEFIDSRLSFSIKEIRKYKKYAKLGDRLAEFRNKLQKYVNENPHVNELNFHDRMSILHGDLNGSNIIVDPSTYQVRAVLDWESACHNFDDKSFDFLKGWFENDAKNEEKFTRRIHSKLEAIGHKELEGREIRKRLTDIVDNSDQLGFYSSSWFPKGLHQDLFARIHVNTFANELEKLLENADDIFKPKQ